MTSDLNASGDSHAGSQKKSNNRKGFFWASAMARRIIAFNLIALCVLLIGMLYLSQFRSTIEAERFSALKNESILMTQILSERMGRSGATEAPVEALQAALTRELPVVFGSDIRIFDADNKLLFKSLADSKADVSGNTSNNSNIISQFLDGLWSKAENALKDPTSSLLAKNIDVIAQNLAVRVMAEGASSINNTTQSGKAVAASGQQVLLDGIAVGALIVSTPDGLMDALRKQERTNILQLFALVAVLSVILSLVLANTIANPIHDLAVAMDAGSTTKLRKDNPDRVRIPDMTARDDEIGYLSSAMQNMTSALYHRIDTNEQFAADVAHEIKNPLASLRSAIETLRIAPEGEKRNRLLDVVEHDVRRLDRLVSDISNASRLDSDLVKEEEEKFDLTRMLDRIVDFHGMEAKERGIEVFFDQPDDKIFIEGLEERLAQVFVNLVTNAVSFCEKGDAVRLWIRHVENRVLIVVEDTGIGIPDDSLGKVSKRFYTNRSEENFGNNSGLGLSISKQIVEAHGGVIWAENIQAKGAAEGAPPLGARFVVGLPG